MSFSLCHHCCCHHHHHHHHGCFGGQIWIRSHFAVSLTLYLGGFLCDMIKGYEHRLRNSEPSSEVQRDADSLTENEISSSATITTPSTTTLTKTFISVFHLKTSSASLTANLILNILLVYSYRAIM